MAVDTRQKRFSILGFGDGTQIHVLFEEDGTVDQDDRQFCLDCYSGFNFDAGGTDPEPRFSFLNTRAPSVYMNPLFKEDGAVDADDRLHLLGLYSNIAASPPGGFTVPLLDEGMLVGGLQPLGGGLV